MRGYFIAFLVSLCSLLQAATYEVTYRIDSYNNDTQDFVIQAFGMQPEGAVAQFDNSFGATAGNRYNQIPRNREAILWLEGFESCRLQSLTLSICSNNKQGSFGVSVLDNKTKLFDQRPKDFTEWYGLWVSKDVKNYVDIDIPLEGLQLSDTTECLGIRVYGGTSEGSVYLNAVTIVYDTDQPVESPLGWVYEKLEKKSTLASGDVVIMYRSGCAAADIDGMETSHYLDAMTVNSVGNLTEPDIVRFTVDRDESGSHYTLTNQYGEKLGATRAQGLAWDQGVTTWDITLGYDGATIASTNTKYGTMRYNAPAGSYARFWNYTSTSLTLPYLYRRVRQLQPVVSTAIQMASERTVQFNQDTVIVRAKLIPESTSDFRILWSSSNPAVAEVRDGIVTLHTLGDVVITATAHDSGVSSQMLLHVVEATDLIVPEHSAVRSGKVLYEGTFVIRDDQKMYDINGTYHRGQ